MSKLDEYQKALAVAANIRKQADKALGVDDRRNDKHRLEFTAISSSCGYYGSSSYTDPLSEQTKTYILKAATRMSASIVKAATGIAEADAERLRVAAVEQAHEVLRAAEDVAEPEADRTRGPGGEP